MSVIYSVPKWMEEITNTNSNDVVIIDDYPNVGAADSSEEQYTLERSIYNPQPSTSDDATSSRMDEDSSKNVSPDLQSQDNPAEEVPPMNNEFDPAESGLSQERMPPPPRIVHKRRGRPKKIPKNSKGIQRKQKPTENSSPRRGRRPRSENLRFSGFVLPTQTGRATTQKESNVKRGRPPKVKPTDQPTSEPPAQPQPNPTPSNLSMGANMNGNAKEKQQNDTLPPGPYTSWTEEDVIGILRSRPDLSESLPSFENQGFDGLAFVLLTTNYMTTEMFIKHGPALKIKTLVDEVKNFRK